MTFLLKLVTLIILFQLNKSIKVSVVQRSFFYKDNCNLHLVIDPNNSRHEMSWKDVKEMCLKTNVVFKNQSFASLVSQLRNRFENATRYVFNKTERESIYNDCNKKCNHCNKDLKKTEMQIDHIIPLVVGGTNDIDNLQILCKPCHFSNTKKRTRIRPICKTISYIVIIKHQSQ